MSRAVVLRLAHHEVAEGGGGDVARQRVVGRLELLLEVDLLAAQLRGLPDQREMVVLIWGFDCICIRIIHIYIYIYVYTYIYTYTHMYLHTFEVHVVASPHGGRDHVLQRREQQEALGDACRNKNTNLPKPNNYIIQ